jgi:hypothetical protein
VVPTIAGGGLAVHTANMASGPDLPAWQHVDTLEVTQIVLAILEAQKTMPWATAATVSREKSGDEFHVTVTMLKTSPAASPGETREIIAAFAVSRLGEDLAKAFGDKDVITLK